MEQPENWPMLYVIAIIVIILIGSYYYEKKRSGKLEKVARILGLSFEKQGNSDTANRHSLFELFSKGHRKIVQNEMWGVRGGTDVVVFGYQYTVGHGRNSTTYKQTVVSFRYPDVRFPAFDLCPENIFHKVGQVFGYQDIDFDSHPGFSSKYLLRGIDEVGIRKLFSIRVLEFFETNNKISVEANGDTLICYIRSKRAKPDEIKMFLEEAEQIHQLFQKEMA